MNERDAAFKAANAAYNETIVDLRLREGGGFKVPSQQRRALAAALEAAAPHMLAAHLLTLAEDTRARGDVGKEGGVEAWDYLTFHAEKAETTRIGATHERSDD